VSQPPYQPPPGPNQPNQPNQPYGPGGQPPADQAPPTSALRFTVQGNVLTSNLVPPTLTIDGFPAPISLGSSTIPIQPGTHRLEVYSQWLRRYGQATLDVSIPPNAMIGVFYAAPFHQFATGALGLTQQKRKGLGVLLGVLIGLLLVIILVIGLGSLVS